MNFLKNLAKNKKGSAFIEQLVVYIAIAAIGIVVVALLWKLVAKAAGENSGDITTVA